MTSSTGKRSKKKHGKINKAINRASRINIIKAVKKILEDGIHPPFLNAKKELIPAKEIKKKKNLNVPESPAPIQAQISLEQFQFEQLTFDIINQEKTDIVNQDTANIKLQQAAIKESSALSIISKIFHRIAMILLLPFTLIAKAAVFIWSRMPAGFKQSFVNLEDRIAQRMALLVNWLDSSFSTFGEGKASDDIKTTAENGESSVVETFLSTPYGFFSKYEQDELLDQYHSETQTYRTDFSNGVDQASDRKTGDIGIKVSGALEVIKSIGYRTGLILLLPFSLISKICVFIWSKIPRVIKQSFINLEQKIAERMSLFMERIDSAFGVVDEKITQIETKTVEQLTSIVRFAIRAQNKIAWMRNRIKEKYRRLMLYTERNRKTLRIATGGALAAIIAITLFIGSISGYEYAYNGKVLGLVKNQNDVYITLDVIGDKLDKEYNAKIIIDKNKNITLKRVIGLGLNLDSREEVLDKFTYLKDMEVQAYAITVDSKQVALLDSKESAEEILAKIQNIYLKKSDRIKYDQVGFAEKVVIKEALTKIGNLKDQDTIVDFMLNGAVAKKKHSVKGGETFSEIATMYGISQAQLLTSNLGVVPEKLNIGQELILTAAAPVLTVQTIETAEYDQSIPYKIKYENTEAKYTGDQSVKNKGIDGKKKVVAQIVRNNGIEVKRTEISSIVAFEPVAQVVLVGTKKLPPLVGTGTFINPTRGVITSRFGTRWGRMHEGIDIGVRTGTAVNAADGGTVIFSGRDGGYGNVIRINHGGNRVTVYAHCSKLLVKKGAKVFQGQHIANSGNTGSSTGPHLHFEIRINGRPVNPSKYI